MSREFAPFVARIAGLPATAMEALGSSRLDRDLALLQEAEAELTREREAMVERLFGLVRGQPPELRRLLLAAKRDCFNGRTLARRRDSADWPVLQKHLGTALDTLVEFEERCETRRRRCDETYREEEAREIGHLLGFLEHREWVRGLSLASPELIRYGPRLRQRAASGHAGRRERRLIMSLVRYVSRTAYKLSPYSTLTRLALGELGAPAETGPALRLEDVAWQPRSLVRLKRYLVDQYLRVLLDHPPLRASLPVRLNSSVSEPELGHFHWIKPSYWEGDEASGELCFRPDSMVRVKLGSPLVAHLCRCLEAGPCGYLELADELVGLPDGPATRQQATGPLDRLLEIGFLELVPPWSGNAVHLERELLTFLADHGEIDGLEEVRSVLGDLVSRQRGYASSPAPLADVEAMIRGIDELWRAAAPLGGLAPETPREKMRTGNIYEDVFLHAGSGGPRTPLLKLSRGKAAELLADAAPLLRLSGLYSHRHDLHHAITAVATERWPGRRDVGVLELYEALRPVWKDFIEYDVRAREQWSLDAFNPLDLPAVEELRQRREHVWSRLPNCIDSEDGESVLCPSSLADLLDPLPRRYDSWTGACLFAQPADEDGHLWVVNRLDEGTGRFPSRFTATMDEELRSAYTDRLEAQASWRLDGEEVELLDLLCARGDTVNIHAIQTPKVLELPGEPCHLLPDRRLRLTDLKVRLDADAPPKVVDAAGRRYLPVHLGGTGHDFLPVIVRFLATLGAGEFWSLIPPQPVRQQGEVMVLDRLRLGHLVLRRKKWIFPRGLLPDLTGNDTRAHAALRRFRETWGLPRRIFVVESVAHAVRQRLYKPQSIDLTSPLQVSMLRNILEGSGDRVEIQEMLPEPEAFPRDRDGERWAVELMLDGLALREGDEVTFLGIAVYFWGAAEQDRLLVECLGPLLEDLQSAGLARFVCHDRFDTRGPHVTALISAPVKRAAEATAELRRRVTEYIETRPSTVELSREELTRRHEECRGSVLCAVDREPGIADNNTCVAFEHDANDDPLHLARSLSDPDPFLPLLEDASRWARRQISEPLGNGCPAEAVGWMAAVDRELELQGAPAEVFWRVYATTLIFGLEERLANAESEVLEALPGLLGERNLARFDRLWNVALQGDDLPLPAARLVRIALAGRQEDHAWPWLFLRQVSHLVMRQLGFPARHEIPLVIFAWFRRVAGTAEVDPIPGRPAFQPEPPSASTT